MTAIDFPNSPSVNQTFTIGERTWKWTGATWDVVVTTQITGPTGPAGAQGPSGVISAVSPIINTGTANSAILGINQSLISISEAQVTNLTSDLDAKAPISSPTFTGTVSGITKSMVGLGNVDNTTDLDKPVSNATQTALNLKLDSATAATTYAPFASPTFTGVPLAPTASAGTNSTQIATTAFVGTAVSNLIAAAPAALDTLNELAAALNNDAAFSTTVTNSLAGKANIAGGNAFTGDTSFTGAGSNPAVNVNQTGGGRIFQAQANGVTQFFVDNTGQFRIGSSAGQPAGAFHLSGSIATTIGLSIRGAASQTADLLQYQNSSSVVLGGMNAVGQNYVGSTTTKPGGTTHAGFTLTTAVGSAGTVTYTTSNNSATQPFAVGQQITIGSGFTPSGYSSITGTVTGVGGSQGAWTFSIANATTGTSSGTATGTISAMMSITSTGPLTTVLVVQGNSAQNVNIQEWQNSSGAALASIAQTGQFRAPSIVGSAFQITSAGVFSNGTTTAPANIQSYFLTTAAANVGQVVRGYATGGAYAQTADLQQWQTWDGTTPTTVAFISNVGNFTAPSVSSTASMSVGSTLTVGSALAGNAGIEIGRVDGTSSTPFIDFHSGATGIDFDSRIIASGGNGTNGQGTLTYTAATNTFTGTVGATTLTSTIATGTSPLSVTSTTKVVNLNADLLDGYDTSQSTSASTVAVRNTDGSLSAQGLLTGGYKTTDTGLTYVGQWTKVATLSMTSQFVNAVALLDFSSNGPGQTDITHGRIFLSAKQQQIMGAPPEPPTVILYQGFNVTVDDFVLVLTQNDATATRFDLYFRNNTYYQNVGFVPVVISSGSNVTLYSAQPYITNLPEGLSVNAANPSETEVTPIDDMSVYFNGVANRFLLTYQGTKVALRNPFRLLVNINGVTQTVNTPDYVWQSPIPYDGLFLDSDGYITLSDIPPLGSTFDGRILAGAATSTRTKNYPFRAVDLLLGA